ncbi:hypothetical protein [Aliiglaciecola sp. M165]|uniref:hypothetical protein n=1 Tax=Aliiglaciecola sp. M165 TaxID=2593649 RepID=UPI0011803A7E|nr:hypothetical protein [Aliiglaciecola sp. M165]TRY32603.1 hypothetical protein FM019_07130 [Aliiglaciecola sp. M165]
MQSLSDKQIEQVNGGAFPLIVAIASTAYSFAGHFAVRSLGGYVASRAASLAALYGGLKAAQSFSGGSANRDSNNVGEKDLKKTD